MHKASEGHARGFCGSRTRLLWSFSGARTRLRRCGWGVACSSPGRRLTFSEYSGISHHQTASITGAPITPRERCHVTQPRARINVSCSRAGHKGATGGRGDVSPRMSWLPEPGLYSHEPIPRLSVSWVHFSPGPLDPRIPCLFWSRPSGPAYRKLASTSAFVFRPRPSYFGPRPS
jgi:hypothetical protein